MAAVPLMAAAAVAVGEMVEEAWGLEGEDRRVWATVVVEMAAGVAAERVGAVAVEVPDWVAVERQGLQKEVVVMERVGLEERVAAVVAYEAVVDREVTVVAMEVAVAALMEVQVGKVAVGVEASTTRRCHQTSGCVPCPRPRRCMSPQTSCPRIPAQGGRRAALRGWPAHQ